MFLTRLVDVLPNIAYSNVNLAYAGALPETEDREKLLKVLMPKKLACLDPSPAFEEGGWQSYEQFKDDVVRKCPGRAKRAGLFVDLTEGCITKYRVALAGVAATVTIDVPPPILELIATDEIAKPPAKMSGNFPLTDVRLESDRVYSEWTNLANLGFNALKIEIPERILRKIFARYRLFSPDPDNIEIVIGVEFVVPPDSMVTDGRLQTQVELMLDTAAIPSFRLWTSKAAIKWNRTYKVWTHSNMKWPIPGVCEATPGVDRFPSEFNLRRTGHDVFIKAKQGAEIQTIAEGYAWFHSSQRQYHYGVAPPLITPPPYPLEYYVEEPTLEIPPGTTVRAIEGPHGSLNTGQTNNPAFKARPFVFTSTFEGTVRIPNIHTSLNNNTAPILPPVVDTGVDQMNGQQGNIFSLPVIQQLRNLNLQSQLKPVVSGPQFNLNADPGKTKPIATLTITAAGKYGQQTNTAPLADHFGKLLPDLQPAGALLLAKATHAGLTAKTTRTYDSIAKTILKLFPERQDILVNTRYGDQLLIVARMLQAGKKPATVRSYMAAYDSIILNRGGVKQPRPPELDRVLKGLGNLSHNPAQAVVSAKRQAYSVEALHLLAIRGVDLLVNCKKWTKYQGALFRSVMLTLFYGRMR